MSLAGLLRFIWCSPLKAGCRFITSSELPPTSGSLHSGLIFLNSKWIWPYRSCISHSLRFCTLSPVLFRTRQYCPCIEPVLPHIFGRSAFLFTGEPLRFPRRTSTFKLFFLVSSCSTWSLVPLRVQSCHAARRHTAFLHYTHFPSLHWFSAESWPSREELCWDYLVPPLCSFGVPTYWQAQWWPIRFAWSVEGIFWVLSFTALWPGCWDSWCRRWLIRSFSGVGINFNNY